MKKKRILPWKHEERLLRKVKSRKWRKKSKKIIAPLDSINCDVFTDGYGSYSYFYDGDFIENDCANESREIIDNVFKYIKEFDEDLELIARELNIDDDKVRKEDKENV